jgi:glycosyltransferase involved in cell wall biosynthesis
MVERVPNEQAIKLYRTADIVAEQFIIGSFGYLSLECMALAKPVVCYIRKKDYLLDPDHCPLISVHPGELEDLLERLIRDGEERRRIGEASRQYVEKYYSLQAVGRRLDRFHRELWLGGVEEVYAENSG